MKDSTQHVPLLRAPRTKLSSRRLRCHKRILAKPRSGRPSAKHRPSWPSLQHRLPTAWFLPPSASLASLAIESLLVPASLVRLIVLLAPCVGQLSSVMRAAAEGAAEILPTGIPRIGEKADFTVAATDCTIFQIRTTAQDGIQLVLILTNKRTSTIVLMPIRTKSENLAASYDKNARFSVKILSEFSISLSYELDAKASRCRAGIFYAFVPKRSPNNGRNRSTSYTLPTMARWLLHVATTWHRRGQR